MSIRTDSYPILGTPEQFCRMRGCDQVSPAVAGEALHSGFLVFGLCTDMKWRRVRRIALDRSTAMFRVVFADNPALPQLYSRTFNKDGILLMEVPNAR